MSNHITKREITSAGSARTNSHGALKAHEHVSPPPPFRVMSHIMYEQLRRLSYALEPLEISGPTWRLLSELHFNGPASIRDLARLAALERSNVSRLVDKMKQDGLVVSCASQDRRVHIVDLSDAGRAKYDAAAVLVAPLNMATVSIFTPDELDRLTGMLKRLSMVLGVDFERPATGPDNQHK